MIIKLSDYYVKKCEKFANDVLPTVARSYTKRGEARQSKIWNDIFIGKLGEVAGYKYLKELGWKNVSKPDFKIYKGRAKSFDQDIMIKDTPIKVHMKTQSNNSFHKFGRSYLLQKSDSLTQNPDRNEILLMAKARNHNTIEIIGASLATEILENGLFEEPVYEAYKKTKVAIYLDNFERCGIIFQPTRSTYEKVRNPCT